MYSGDPDGGWAAGCIAGATGGAAAGGAAAVGAAGARLAKKSPPHPSETQTLLASYPQVRPRRHAPVPLLDSSTTPPEVSAGQLVRGPPAVEKHESRTPGSSASGAGVCAADVHQHASANRPASRVFMPTSLVREAAPPINPRSATAAASMKRRSVERDSRAPAA
jgi:hypothetical protein